MPALVLEENRINDLRYEGGSACGVQRLSQFGRHWPSPSGWVRWVTVSARKAPSGDGGQGGAGLRLSVAVGAQGRPTAAWFGGSSPPRPSRSHGLVERARSTEGGGGHCAGGW